MYPHLNIDPVIFPKITKFVEYNVLIMSFPTSGIKVTRKKGSFQKKMDGYPGAVDDLVHQ
ncbi:MAG: hypothetical protein GPJ54_12700 [Candidatus Heimdallarchaeota archaeon]|nr:hypothetical protein [Candidatus Heimdallarchaeota archaeon]